MMIDPSMLQQIQAMNSQGGGYAMINPAAMQGMSYDQLSSLNPQQLASLQQMSALGANIGMIMNPYGGFGGSQAQGQSSNPQFQSVVGFPPGSMPQGFGGQSPYAVIGMPQKPMGDQDKNKDSQLNLK